MKPKPIPKTELVVVRFSRHLNLVPHSNDAKDFIIKEASNYGVLDGSPFGCFSLEIQPGYDITEVAEYFESYNS